VHQNHSATFWGWSPKEIQGFSSSSRTQTTAARFGHVPWFLTNTTRQSTRKTNWWSWRSIQYTYKHTV